MPRPKPLAQLDFEAFLDLEARSSERHEWVEGLIFPLAEGTDLHNLIAGNLFALLRPAARAKGCTVFIENMLLKTPTGAAYYPDLMVTCEPNTGARYKEAPCLLIEVLSQSTEDIDRGEKLQAYRRIPSLMAYVLVASERRLVELYRRLEGEAWLYGAWEEGSIPLPCLDLSVGLEAIYADTPLG